MNKMIPSALLALLMLSVGSIASAANISKGVSEVSGDFNITYDYQSQGAAVSPQYGSVPKSETDTFSGTARIGYGYFITDEIQLGGSTSENISSTIPYRSNSATAYSTDTFQTSLDVNAKYHFLQLLKKNMPIVPYLGAQLGYVNYYMKTKNSFNNQQESYTANTFGYGGSAGAKFFVTENLALNAELNYKRFQVELLKGLPEVKHDQLNWLVGLSYYFGK